MGLALPDAVEGAGRPDPLAQPGRGRGAGSASAELGGHLGRCLRHRIRRHDLGGAESAGDRPRILPDPQAQGPLRQLLPYQDLEHGQAGGQITVAKRLEDRRGRVLPIGGLKEKIIAAHRGGIKKILIPKENEKDLKDVPKSISKHVEIILVEHMDEVLTHALILDDGYRLFKNVDIPFEITPEETEKPKNLV